jgi:hypothetical protein
MGKDSSGQTRVSGAKATVRLDPMMLAGPTVDLD